MNTSIIALMLLIFIALIVMQSSERATELTATGTNTVIGNAWAEGDTFAEETHPTGEYSDQLYAGIWAHAYVPTGTDGTNSAESQRTVPARTESRTFTNPATNGFTYNLTSGYGATTVIAKASKTGVIGMAEAFSEGSSRSRITDTPLDNAFGASQLVAFITHTGTGTANASAAGSAGYSATIKRTTVENAFSGSVNGSAAINAANNYGGAVNGTAWMGSSSLFNFGIAACSFEYLSLSSSRESQSALSAIDGAISGQTSGYGSYTLSDGISKSESHTSGNLYATATTYKLGDSITPGPIIYQPLGMKTQLEMVDATKTSLPAFSSLWEENGPRSGLASSYLLSMSEERSYPSYNAHSARTGSFTSAGVIRTLSDASEAYGPSFIDNGTILASFNTELVPGGNNVTQASASADNIFMGSGAHLVSRLTGANPMSTADLTTFANDFTLVKSSLIYGGSIEVTGNVNGPNNMVRAVGPSYSPSGTSDDATGSYLTASNIRGTATHDAWFTSPTSIIVTDISEINIWSWIAGDDSRTHAESKYSLSPYVATPVYTSDPIGALGVTTGPIVTPDIAATSRSVDVEFNMSIIYHRALPYA